MRLPLTLIAAALLLPPPAAQAHGDPVSDRLLVADVYFPETAVRSDLAAGLTGAVARANEDGYALKVALVASPSDLGPASSYFGRPEAFAQYLASDLSGFFKGVTLVVMPGALGVGVGGDGASVGRERDALGSLEPGTAPGPLAEAATEATRRLAALGPRDGGGASFLGDRLVIVAVAFALLALLVGGRLLAARRRAGPSPAP